MTQVISVREDGSVRVREVNDMADRCKHSFQDECDINFILRDYKRSGVVRHLNEARARYEDVSSVSDYSEAMCVVKRAEDEFRRMPVKARKVFGYSAAAFLDAAHDPSKRALLEQAGLIPPEKPADVVKPPVEAPAVPVP